MSTVLISAIISPLHVDIISVMTKTYPVCHLFITGLLFPRGCLKTLRVMSIYGGDIFLIE